MKTQMPKVSVIMPSYNHAGYIQEAIDSVLNQTYSDFEMIISDDASTDNTSDILKLIEDSRVNVHIFEENQGATVNTNYLIDKAQGEYIALINSDDVWTLNRLEEGVKHLDAHPECGACFSWAALIDEDSNIIDENTSVFKKKNKPKEQWQKDLFCKGNCLCHPSVLIRKSVYDKVGKYKLALRQLPDFEMWTRVTKFYDIYIIPEVLVKHRRFVPTVNNQNTSSVSVSNSLRDMNESLYILIHYFDNQSDESFTDCFHSLFKNKDSSSKEELICERYFLLSHYYMSHVSIIQAFLSFLKDYDVEGVRNTFSENFNYTMKDFFEVGANINLLKIHDAVNGPNMDMHFTGNMNSCKNRFKAAIWAIFGIDTAAYRFMYKVIRKIRR